MAITLRKHLAAAQRAAIGEGVPANLAEGRLRAFETLLEANPRIPAQLDEVGLLAAACSRIATGSKFDAAELDQRLAQNGELHFQQRVDAKLCLGTIGLVARA